MSEVSKAKYSDDGKELWITLRVDGEYVILHLQGAFFEWEKKDSTLNIRVNQ